MKKKAASRAAAADYIKRKYKGEPEALSWRNPEYHAFRHADNRKMYALLMTVKPEKLGISGEDALDVLCVKSADILMTDILLRQEGYFPGYMAGRGNWISVLLDGTVPFDDICGMIDISYRETASKEEKLRLRPPKEWLVPANPEYYDIEHAFDDTDVIEWKQSSSVKPGDTVFMYVAAPVSAILYKCEALETNIKRAYRGKNVTIKMRMRIKLLKRYPPDKFTFSVLNEKYGIFAVRGPRGVPEELSRALKR
jgi:predicted DNA-binding protein (MmcQ/YjbR family)